MENAQITMLIVIYYMRYIGDDLLIFLISLYVFLFP